jgi:hypothetical protein
MANQRYKDNADHGNIVPDEDGFPTFQSNLNDRKFHFDDYWAAMGIKTYTFADRNDDTFAEGSVRFISDGRKEGEGAGNGTGVMCRYDGANWITYDQGTTVTA